MHGAWDQCDTDAPFGTLLMLLDVAKLHHEGDRWIILRAALGADGDKIVGNLATTAKKDPNTLLYTKGGRKRSPSEAVISPIRSILIQVFVEHAKAC